MEHHTVGALAVLNRIYFYVMIGFAFVLAVLVSTLKSVSAASPLTPAELNAYQQRYPHFFPFHDCILLTVKSVHQVEEGNGVSVFVTADVNEVVRGDCKQGLATFAIRGCSEDLKNTRERFEKLAGQQAVLAFSPCPVQLLNPERDLFYASHPKVDPWLHIQNAKEAIWIHKIYMPLSASVADLARLKATLANEKKMPAQSEASFVKCLQERWTEARLKDFCRPETRHIVMNARHRSFDSSYLWLGHLYPGLDLGTGKAEVIWGAEIIEGVPEVSEIYVTQEQPIGKSCYAWQPEFNWLDDLYSNRWSDDDYVKFRTTTMIESLVTAYLMRYKQKWSSEFGTQWANRHMSQTSLVHRDGAVIGYSCPLADGQILIATLDKEGKIAEILINGKDNQIWTKALSEANKNLDIVNSLEFINTGKVE